MMKDSMVTKLGWGCGGGVGDDELICGGYLIVSAMMKAGMNCHGKITINFPHHYAIPLALSASSLSGGYQDMVQLKCMQRQGPFQ